MIKDNVRNILNELPDTVELVAAAKGRSPQEILDAVEAGVKIIGQNYVQEAQKAFEVIKSMAKQHFIGHLQKNKVRKAVKIFDMIETVDSIKIAEEIDKASAQIHKIMQVLIEINSGKEQQKFGVFPEETEQLVRRLSQLKNIKIMGLMTMGPMFGDPEEARRYFIETRKIFDKIKTLNIPNADMKYLSMGMSNSYKVAISEGANVERKR